MGTRVVAALCLAAIILGPVAWIASLLGFSIAWLSVRQAFIVMLLGFAAVHVVAVIHLIFVSRLPKAQKWEWVQSLFVGFRVVASFEYLFSEGRKRQPDAERRARAN
jgi:hypothetical protein